MSSTEHGNASELSFRRVCLAGKPVNTRWDLECRNGRIHAIIPHDPPHDGQADNPKFIAPSLCHPHIHLDKCFLLQHPDYADLEIQQGDFAEALRLTNQAKTRYGLHDLVERGRALIEESIVFGVTHMRAFVEVDLIVRYRCLTAGVMLKTEFEGRCHIQLCVFAQDPIMSYDDGGAVMKGLLQEAAAYPGVETFGSTPYVEKHSDCVEKNITFATRTAMKYKLHLDFHIDYNIDPNSQTWILHALDRLYVEKWPTKREASNFRTISFGHCTRMTLFGSGDWPLLRVCCRDLPVTFIGLPTSDLYMMGRPKPESQSSLRDRGTLQVLQLIKTHGFNAAIGINNVGNAFTPQGDCDPLRLASLGVGVYQAGTKTDVDILFQCVSSRAKAAIGCHARVESFDVGFKLGDPADLVVFATSRVVFDFRCRKSIQHIVYDPGNDRTAILGGQVVNQTQVQLSPA